MATRCTSCTTEVSAPANPNTWRKISALKPSEAPNDSTTVATSNSGDSTARSSNVSYLHRYFRTVRQAATVSNPWGIKNENYHGQGYICTGLRHP